jgi:hypothetical protein
MLSRWRVAVKALAVRPDVFTRESDRRLRCDEMGSIRFFNMRRA